MAFPDQMQRDLAVFFNTSEFAVSASYLVKATGATSAVSVILDYVQDLQAVAMGQARTGTVQIKASDVSRPAIYDEITIDSVVWRVDQVLAGDGVSWTLLCSTDHRLGV